MLPLITAILIASLLGSLHCAGMCGPFVALATAPPTPLTVAGREPARSAFAGLWSLQSAYHLGRLTTYLSLGALAGGVGSAMDIGGAIVGLQRGAAVLAAVFMIGFGLIALARAAGVRLLRPRAPARPAGRWVRLAQAAHARAMSLPPATRAATIGLLTTLLPCGWLYAFVVAALGTADPLKGAAAMVAFWIGTLPVLIALGASLRAVTGPLARRMPALTAGLLLVVGVATLVDRALIPSSGFAALAPPPAAATDAQRLQAIRDLDAEQMPCCPLGAARKPSASPPGRSSPSLSLEHDPAR